MPDQTITKQKKEKKQDSARVFSKGDDLYA